jgi:isoprenylcysteine carboxyl methyltransferase (ICMT) family protein YpbQ
MSRELNGNHLFIYKEAFTHEQNMHNFFKVSQFLSFGLLFMVFYFVLLFFCIHIFGIVGCIFGY